MGLASALPRVGCPAGHLRLAAIQACRKVRLSPSSRRKGTSAKAPLREAFGEWDNLKRVLIVFFGIMCAQGAVWYLSFFYVQVFLTRSLGVPDATKDAWCWR